MENQAKNAQCANSAEDNPLSQAAALYSNILANAKMSDETNSFITCILLLKDVFLHVCDAMELMYGASQAEGIISNEFYKKYIKLEDFLFKYVSASINQNIGNTHIVEI
jgi:hypothetical protein